MAKRIRVKDLAGLLGVGFVLVVAGVLNAQVGGHPAFGPAWISSSASSVDFVKDACVYNTVADPSGNYERVCLRWNAAATRFELTSEKGGTGTVRGLIVRAGAGQDTQLGAGAATTWEIISSTGNIQPATDDARSLGLAGKAAQYVFARRGLVSSKTKALTTGAATNVVQFAVTNNGFSDATLQYAAFCSDGTDHILRRGAVYVSAVAEGTTVTCATPTEVGTPLATATSGSFSTFTWACATGANTAMVTLESVCSLTETTLDLYYRPDVMQSAAFVITPQ